MKERENGKLLFVDIHCHILPEVDDGAKSTDMAIRMLANAERQGIAAVIATPHYKQHEIHIPPESIARRAAELEERAVRAGISVKIYPGNELFYHHDIDELIEQKQVAALAGTAYVLIEFQPAEQYAYIRNAVDSLCSSGYHPIIAHVERYVCLEKKPERLNELKSMGALIQLNAAGITGLNGRWMQKVCKAILKEGLADFIATDAHRDTGSRDNTIEKCARLVYKKYGKEYADKLFWKNAYEFLSINGKKMHKNTTIEAEYLNE